MQGLYDKGAPDEAETFMYQLVDLTGDGRIQRFLHRFPHLILLSSPSNAALVAILVMQQLFSQRNIFESKLLTAGPFYMGFSMQFLKCHGLKS